MSYYFVLLLYSFESLAFNTNSSTCSCIHGDISKMKEALKNEILATLRKLTCHRNKKERLASKQHFCQGIVRVPPQCHIFPQEIACLLIQAGGYEGPSLSLNNPLNSKILRICWAKPPPGRRLAALIMLPPFMWISPWRVAGGAGHVFIQYVVTPQLFYCFGC